MVVPDNVLFEGGAGTDEACVVLRPAHQHQFHAQAEPADASRPERRCVCLQPANRHECTPSWSPATPDGRWRCFGIDELLSRDKVNLDIFWLRDENLEDSANLPAPDVIAAEIVEDLRAALEQFEAILDEALGNDENNTNTSP